MSRRSPATSIDTQAIATTPNGPVRTTSLTREIDRSRDRLSLWRQQTTACPASFASSRWLRIGRDLDVDRSAHELAQAGRVMACLGPDAPPHLFDLVSRLARSPRPGLRLYVLIDSAAQPHATKELLACGRLSTVIRTATALPATFVVGSATGVLALGSPGRTATWCIDTDRDVSDLLRAVFGHIFWREAISEALPGEARLQAPLRAPFELAPAGDVSLRGGTFGRVLPDWPAAISHLVAPEIHAHQGYRALPAPVGLEVALMPPTGAPASFDQALALAGRGTQVVWSDLELPRLALGADLLVHLFLGTNGSSLTVKLDRLHGAPLRDALDDVARTPDWRFENSRALGEMTGTLITRGATAACSLSDELVTKEVNISPSDLGQLDLDRLFPEIPPGALAKKVIQRVRLTPPHAPKNAAVAGSSLDWERTDRALSKRQDDLADAVRRAQLGARELATHTTAGPPITYIVHQLDACADALTDVRERSEPGASLSRDETIEVADRLLATGRVLRVAIEDLQELASTSNAADSAGNGAKGEESLSGAREQLRHALEKANSSALEVPTVERLTVGRLMSLKSQNFLVIDDWSELMGGQSLARHLGATLVASR